MIVWSRAKHSVDLYVVTLMISQLLGTWATKQESFVITIYFAFCGNYSYSQNTPREGVINSTWAQHDDLDHTGSLTQERLGFLDHFGSCGQD